LIFFCINKFQFFFIEFKELIFSLHSNLVDGDDDDRNCYRIVTELGVVVAAAAAAAALRADNCND